MDTFRLIVDQPGQRLDVLISQHRPDLTRSRVQKLIGQGLVLLDGRPVKAAVRPKARQTIEVQVPPPQPLSLAPEEMDLAVLFEDEALLVISKPPGLVVHPAPGHATGTLVQGLLHHCPDLKGIGGRQRPGIVHRLDKDTSGLIVVAKDDRSHQSLSRAFKAKTITKTYLALVLGRPAWKSKEVEAALGRHPVKRKKMAVVQGGRRAISRFKVTAQLQGPLSLVEVDLLTGRTHQIRVHAVHLGHPVLGDPLYGSRAREKQLAQPARELAARTKRQMLHAWRLAFDHPLTGQRLFFEAPLPQDMASLVNSLGGGPDPGRPGPL
ncbi:MAG: RluA family pseudouridine synthase [Deltaproteobacteria bacterium]|nr:RluA family pseudouridine synthase [Deltaproteobacteria bacterium]